MIRRETLIQRLIAEGHRPTDIFETVAKEFRVSARTVERQYYSIVNELSSLATEGRKELRGTLMARYEKLYQMAIESANIKSALETCNAQAKLSNLYQHDKTEKKLPEFIEISEQDFSGTLKVVGDEQ